MADKAKHGEGPEHEWTEDCDLIDSLRAQLAAEIKMFDSGMLRVDMRPPSTPGFATYDERGNELPWE